MKKILSTLFVFIVTFGAIFGFAACGDEASFSVNFIVDGEIYSTVKLRDDGPMVLPTDPAKEGFTFAGWYLDENFEKAFNESALKELVITGTVSIYAKWTKGDAAHSHSASDWIIDVEATCENDGAKHKECIECSAVIETVLIEKTAHTPAAAVKENEQDSTCAAVGHCDSVVYCSICKAEISREQKEIAKKAHIPAAAVKENVQDSTTTAIGHYDSVVYCSICHSELSREQKG